MDDRVKDMRKNLTDLIDEVKAHSDRLTDWKVLPVLEVNVFLAKVNKLYEQTVVLKTYIDSNYALGKFDAHEVHDDLKKVDELMEQAQAAHQENLQQVTEEVLTEPAVESTEPTPTEQPKAPEATPTTDESVVEKYQGDDNSVVDKLGRQPISKLIDAIGINEKYLFSNELFNEDMAGFLDFVGQIDRLNNGLEAIDLFNEYRAKYGWDAQQQSTIDLLKLVERRFLQE